MLRLSYAIIFVLVAASPVKAASFDCDKAKTDVEKMICADAQLSNLDEELDRAYRDARTSVTDEGHLRKEQRVWLKERNACKDAQCIEATYRARPLELAASEAKRMNGQSNREEFRYTLAHGKGWSVCEAYLRFLNSTPETEEPPICDLKLDRVPGLGEPNWEVLDVQKHLPIVHQIELILGGGRIEPAPDQDFEGWKAQFRKRVEEQGQRPRLRRARMRLVPEGVYEVGLGAARQQIPVGKIETVLSYDLDLSACERRLSRAREGWIGGLGRTQTDHFLFDENTQQVRGDGAYVLRLVGEWRTYHDRPYYVYRQFGDYVYPSGVRDRGGHLYIKRLEPALQSTMRGNPPYIDRDLCRIRYDYPFPAQDCSNARTPEEKSFCEKQ